jgi:hypothetical protein
VVLDDLRPIPPMRSISPSQQLKRAGCYADWSSKHASWLNMVEIEIGVLASLCLDRRIESYSRLLADIRATRPTLRHSGAPRSGDPGTHTLSKCSGHSSLGSSQGWGVWVPGSRRACTRTARSADPGALPRND